MKQLKLGVLGVSGHFISRIILPLTQSKVVKVVGLASRNEEKAKVVAQKWGIEKTYGSYEELLCDKDIEAVYIPLPNHLHLEWIKKAVTAGKHVICEKPLTMNAKETEELISYVKPSGMKVMEAFMYRHHPKWKRVRQIIDCKEIGEVTSIHTMFAYNNTNPENIRNVKAYGGGALMDIGCYAISSSRYIMNAEPNQVISLITEHPEFKTDIVTSGILDYGKARCLFTTSTTSMAAQEVKIYGTSGTVTVKIPFNDHYDCCGEIIVHNGLGERIVTFEPTNQYQVMFEAFAEAVIEDKKVPLSLEDSLNNMRIIDALKASHEEKKWIAPCKSK